MSHENDSLIVLYTFGVSLLLGCGCHIVYKCFYNSTPSSVDEQYVEMDNITNVLHTNEIINDLERFSFLPDMTKFINKEECVICTEILSEQQIRILKCSHQFHQCCIDEWFNTSQQLECPICGLDISQIDDSHV